MKKLLTLLLYLGICTPQITSATTWTKVFTTSQRVSIIYFINKDVGFVANGTVPGGTSETPRLYRTSDGGNTWNQVSVPGLASYGIQDIHFIDGQTGYAVGGMDGVNLWRTTDKGVTWYELEGEGLYVPIAIRKTDAGLVVTDFFKELILSTDGGQSFIKQNTSPIPESHLGIDFVDSVHGVVDGNYRQSTSSWYYTEDGGKTWKPNGTKMESWSIYGQKGTPNFFACPEGYSNSPSTFSDVYRSTNYGKSFSTAFRFQFQMIGDIQGAGDILYTQSAAAGTNNQGVYRSTDLGSSWQLIGGYNAFGDTRFSVVPECGGNIIFIADKNGAIYRATDDIGTGTGGGGTELSCVADYKNMPSVSPGERVSVPIGLSVAGNSSFVGKTPSQIEYVVEFSTLAVDTSKFNTSSDIVPPVGWAVVSAAMRGDSLKVVLNNVSSNAMTQTQRFGFAVLTILSNSPRNISGVILRRVTIADDCSPINVLPSIEQSTITKLILKSSSVAYGSITDEGLALYPNPTTNILTLRSELLKDGNAHISIIDVRGTVVQTFTSITDVSNEYHLSLGSLPKGTYTLQLEAKGQTLTRSFFLE